jgi:hypothetical protein
VDAGEWLLRREEGWDAVARSVFCPARPGLPRVFEQVYGLSREQARLAVAGETSNVRWLRPGWQVYERIRERARRLEELRARAQTPALAWERLAPEGWRGDARRWFVGDKVPRGALLDEPTLSVAWTGWVLRREPPSLHYLMTLCADPANVVLAEDLAREACRRIGARGSGDPPPVIWLAEEDARLFDYQEADPFRARADAMLGLDFGDHPEGEWRTQMLLLAKRDLVRANAWPKEGGPNPFEPIVGIWRLGYALSAVLEVGVVLAASAPKLEELLGERAAE